jgi:PIN domain nuclease of toxin-antitoxin system
LGRLPKAALLAADLPAVLAGQGFQQLPITVEHGLAAGNLAGPHRDPFDRMLIAQAVAADMTFVSNEVVFDRYGVRRVW